MINMAEFDWDAGIPYKELKRRIRTKLDQNKKYPIKYVKLLVYAVQLRNGARISEALDGLRYFAKGQRPDVLVRKKKKFTKKGNPIKPDYRAFIWPEFIKKPIFNTNTLPIIENMKVGNLKVSARGLIGVNTHSLRYARTTQLTKENKTDPIIVSKILHHSDPKFTMRYVQQSEADALNERVR